MPSLLETLESDLRAEQSALEPLTRRRDTLEAEAEDARSYDGVRDGIAAVEGEMDPHLTRITALNADITRERSRRERVRSAPSANLPDQPEEGPVTPVGGFARMPAALTDQFLGSDEWRGYVANVAPKGFSHSARVESPKIDVQGSLIPGLVRRGLVTGGSATSAGALILPDQVGIFDEGTFQRELSVLDVITRGTTDSDTVEYVRTTGFTNLAAIVPEADSVDPTDNTGRKPWSSIALERVQESVQTIAHGEAATTRALSDAGQMRTIIENWLRYGLLEELEDEIVNGAGGADHFDGITTVSGTQPQAFVTDIATTIRKAKTKVRVVGKARANAVVLNPYDWEALDLFMTFEGPGSNFRQATDESPARLFGLRIVESEAVDVGQAIIGDFRRAVLWDRQQTTVQATSGYMDFFMKNLVAILAELRAAFGVIRPAAFVIADVGTGS
jgi:HK97 family phage major capsid protein